MIQIIGARQTGRTTKLIELCQKMNEEHGINDTFIIVANMNRARSVYSQALEMGYMGMPYPVPVAHVPHSGSYYKYALVDDAEIVLQTVLGGRIDLTGYVVVGESSDVITREVEP